MASPDPAKHGQIHKAFGSLSASVLAGHVIHFLQSVSTSGWAAAAAALDPVTAVAVLSTSAIFGISHACQGKAERKKAAELAKVFEKLSKQEGHALDLLNKIADGEIGIELSWFGVEAVAERTKAMLSGKLDELLASVLDGQRAGFAALSSRMAELCDKLDRSSGTQVTSSGAGAIAIVGGVHIEKPHTVIIGNPVGTLTPAETTEGSDTRPATMEASKIPGPPRVAIARLPITGPHMFGRDTMLKTLDDAWADAAINVFSLFAGGGIGKSALVNHWLAAMAQDDYRGALRVYGHSFYSQGTSDKTASADTFIAEALTWFGDPDPTKGSPWAKGERLADLVRAERTLLILDGMEPLQHPPGPIAGRVTDPGLQALLRELAARNPGLCVITTREHVADLDPFAGKTARQESLDVLPVEAGANLLVQLGVTGPVDEMKKVSEAFGNHALALTLLGTYLAKAHGSDVRKHAEVTLTEADKTVSGGHARRVMRSYEKWLGDGPELSILRMMGLFNRPAEAGCVAALREPPVIRGLTDGIAGLSEADWNVALSNLREIGLLATPDDEQPGSLDAHPLVRQHFGEWLEQGQPEAWREGHDRLYEYLKGPGCKKELPDTAEEMAPLYAAVLHGCAAGRHEEALGEVYWRRIQRGEEGYNDHKLGAFGADLGMLANLFEEPWRRPVASMGEVTQASVFGLAGYCLRALGRLTEAVEPMLAGLE